MNSFAEVSVHYLQRFEPSADALYSIDTIAHLADVPRHLVLLCCRHGVLSPQIDPEYGGYLFDPSTIRTLQRVRYLYSDCGINFAGIRIILGLMDEVERLRAGQAYA